MFPRNGFPADRINSTQVERNLQWIILISDFSHNSLVRFFCCPFISLFATSSVNFGQSMVNAMRIASKGRPRTADPSFLCPGLLGVLRRAFGLRELLLVFFRQHRRLEGDGEPVDFAGEFERHLIIPVIDRRAGVGPNVESLVPGQCERHSAVQCLQLRRPSHPPSAFRCRGGLCR